MRWFQFFVGLIAVVSMSPFETSFAQNLPKFSGLMFGDYYYALQNHDQTQKDMQAFDYRRIYLTADYEIARDFEARFRLESDPSSSNLPNGEYSTAIKDAYLNWENVTKGGSIIIGLQGTPDINMAEDIFGYRSLEKTIQDLHGISNSRDLGVSFNQKLSNDFAVGVLLGNNSDNFVPTNRYKSGYLFFQINLVKELTILVDGQYAGAPEQKNTSTGDVIVNYLRSDFSIGVQGFLNSVQHGGPNGSTLSRNGISVNGWVSLVEKVRLVARYDYFTPITDAAYRNTTIAFSTQNFLMGAIDYAVRKNVHIMPNVEYLSYELSGSKSDVTARATFYFDF